MRSAGLLFALALLLPAAGVWAQEKEKQKEPSGAEHFPEAEGRENVVTTCSACHTLVRVATNHRSLKAWTGTIKVHEGRGLHLDEDEIPPIVKYLAAWFGPMVNINTATPTELVTLPQVDEKLAQAIVAYREKKGPFKKVEDLTGVKGITSAWLDKVKTRLETGETETQDAKKK